MPSTTKFGITYPAPTAAPNVPADLQALAESTEAGINRVAVAPLAIAAKADGQTLAVAGTVYDVRWNTNTHIQGITHTSGDPSFVVSEAGIYNINAKVAFQGATVAGSIWVSVNGIRNDTTQTDEAGSAAAWPKPRLIHALKLAAGDSVKIVASSNVTNTALTSQSHFQMSKIAGY